MKTEVGVRVCFSVRGDLGHPWTGHHDASGAYGSFLDGVYRSGVLRVRHTDVVGVDDEELGVFGIAEFFGEGLLCGKREDTKREER